MGWSARWNNVSMSWSWGLRAREAEGKGAPCFRPSNQGSLPPSPHHLGEHQGNRAIPGFMCFSKRIPGDGGSFLAVYRYIDGLCNALSQYSSYRGKGSFEQALSTGWPLAPVWHFVNQRCMSLFEDPLLGAVGSMDNFGLGSHPAQFQPVDF